MKGWEGGDGTFSEPFFDHCSQDALCFSYSVADVFSKSGVPVEELVQLNFHAQVNRGMGVFNVRCF